VVSDSHFGNEAVDMDMQVLLGKPPKMTRDVAHKPRHLPPFDVAGYRPQGRRLPRAAHAAVASSTSSSPSATARWAA
jgi:phosphoribosylformylglycinamidine synthase